MMLIKGPTLGVDIRLKYGNPDKVLSLVLHTQYLSTQYLSMFRTRNAVRRLTSLTGNVKANLTCLSKEEISSLINSSSKFCLSLSPS